MISLDLRYTYNTPWRLSYQDYWNKSSDYKEPSFCSISDGVILPSLKDEKLPWGMGGIIDKEGTLIESSIDIGAFGAKYEYDKSKEIFIDETVIYLGILPLHWGHFLMNFISRLWILLNDNVKHNKYRLAYLPRYFDGPVDGQYKECLEYLGIDLSRMFRIVQPTKVKEIIIPENSMHWGQTFSPMKYRRIIDCLKGCVLSNAKSLTLTTYEKVYFTRRQFAGSDIGEAEIEANFLRNGFKVLAPEKLSFTEQVWYIHSAKEIAAIGGTITHNYMFANKDAKLIVLNRFPIQNSYQFRINFTFDLSVTLIDVYNKWQLKSIRQYGDHHIWVENSNELKSYFKDHNMEYVSYYYQTFIGNALAFFKLWVIEPTYWNFRASLGRLKNSFLAVHHY